MNQIIRLKVVKLIDVIIKCSTSKGCDSVVEKISLESGILKDRLEAINTLFAEIPDDKLQVFRSMPEVVSIDIDEPLFALESVAEYQTLMKVDEFKRNVSRGNGVKIGIIDTGVNTDYPSLKPNFIEGHNIVKKTNDIIDTYDHGTKVAGIICSVGPDFVGVAPESKFYAVKAMSDSGTIRASYIINGVQWLIDKGVDIINISLGGSTCGVFSDIVNLATKSNIIVVASAGNDSTPSAPACTTGVICVGSARKDNGNYVTYVSCISNRIDLVTEAFRLKAISADGLIRGFSGTSASSSVITGVLALLKSANPTLSRQGLIDKLYSICKDLGVPGKDSTFGRGIPIMTAEEIQEFQVTVSSNPPNATINIV